MKTSSLAVGQLIRHKLFQYRGVIADIDPVFMQSDAWYERMAKSRPPKDEPWYHVLVDNSDQQTYVAQRNLEPDTSDAPIQHPLLTRYFTRFDGERYWPFYAVN